MKKLMNTCLVIIVCVLLVMPQISASAAAPQVYTVDEIQLISQKADGTQGNNNSDRMDISADGRYIAFESGANNLVANDFNGVVDIFVMDRQTGALERVSISSSGTQANGASSYPSISSDGRYVAFASDADNLVTGDNAGYKDVFVYDRELDTIERVSVTTAGAEDYGNSTTPSISADGSLVAFTSGAVLAAPDIDYLADIYVRNRTSNTTVVVSTASDGTKGDLFCEFPAISGDGSHVAFSSNSTNLVAGDTNSASDIFVKNISTGDIERVSQDSEGAQANAHSAMPALNSDGSIVAFQSYATNLVAGDTNNQADIFLVNRGADTIQRVSVTSDGAQANNYSEQVSIDGSGRYVVFSSGATNLSTDDTNGCADIFLYDRNDAMVTIISVDPAGDSADGSSDVPAISQDGSSIAFRSSASTIISSDINGYRDVFATYTVNSLDQPVLRSPGADAIVYGGRPTFKWYPVTDATVYDVEMYGLSDELLGAWTKGVGACDPGPYCEYRIPFDLESAYGAYDWRVRARNTTTSLESAWSVTRSYTYTQLARTSLISPADGYITKDHYSTLKWTDITGATMYLVQFRLPDDTFLFNVLVSDATYCDGSTCTWTLDHELTQGDYKWHVRAKNGRNFGRWTAYWTLTISE